VRAYRPGADDAALLAVNNAAFAGHPENGDWDAAELAERTSRDWFDPAGLLLAWRGEELLGFHWTKWHSHDSDETPAHEPVGEVYVLGVAPAAQGLGLGRVLLTAGLRHLHDRGCRLAMLYVDRANPSAVGLYESEGFETEYREVCYSDLVPPVVEHLAADLRRPAF
jgi:mycothiol synthase